MDAELLPRSQHRVDGPVPGRTQLSDHLGQLGVGAGRVYDHGGLALGLSSSSSSSSSGGPHAGSLVSVAVILVVALPPPGRRRWRQRAVHQSVAAASCPILTPHPSGGLALARHHHLPLAGHKPGASPLPSQGRAQEAKSLAGARGTLEQSVLRSVQGVQNLRHVIPLARVRDEGEVYYVSPQAQGGGGTGVRVGEEGRGQTVPAVVVVAAAAPDLPSRAAAIPPPAPAPGGPGLLPTASIVPLSTYGIPPPPP